MLVDRRPDCMERTLPTSDAGQLNIERLTRCALGPLSSLTECTRRWADGYRLLH